MPSYTTVEKNVTSHCWAGVQYPYTDEYTYIYIHIFIYIYMYIYNYIYIYTYIYIHIYIYIYILYIYKYIYINEIIYFLLYIYTNLNNINIEYLRYNKKKVFWFVYYKIYYAYTYASLYLLHLKATSHLPNPILACPCLFWKMADPNNSPRRPYGNLPHSHGIDGHG